MRVVGAGLGRTGTASLKQALEILLGGTCHHMFEVKTADQARGWHAAAEGNPPDWHEFLADYTALVDWPGASFWPELSTAFPDALVLLSQRPLDEWYDSAASTIFNSSRPAQEDPDDSVLARKEMWLSILRNRFTEDLDDREATIEAAAAHNQAVIDTVPAERLLIYTPGDGWEPLCEALDLPVPDQPYPHTNTRQQFQDRAGDRDTTSN
jgi:hypothetical protein